jgi:hypothetical protein
MRIPAMIALAILGLGACGGETGAAVETSGVADEPQPLGPEANEEELAALSGCGPVTAEGYCGIAFGAAPAAAREKFPVALESYAGEPAANDPDACFELFAVQPVQGVSFLVEAGSVQRVDVLSGGPRTADSFGVGTSGDAIRQKFDAAISEQPNKYEPEVTELMLSQGTATFVFELQDGKVRAWRAGVEPAIHYVEHCG